MTRHTTGQDNVGLHQENSGVHQDPDNTGVHQNIGVHQNANTNAPQNDHDDPHNNPTIKREITIDATGDDPPPDR